MSSHDTEILPGKTVNQLSTHDVAITSVSKVATVRVLSEMLSDSGRPIIAEALVLLQKQLLNDDSREKDREEVERFLDYLFDPWAEKRMGITRKS